MGDGAVRVASWGGPGGGAARAGAGGPARGRVGVLLDAQLRTPVAKVAARAKTTTTASRIQRAAAEPLRPDAGSVDDGSFAGSVSGVVLSDMFGPGSSGRP